MKCPKCGARIEKCPKCGSVMKFYGVTEKGERKYYCTGDTCYHKIESGNIRAKKK